MKRIALLAGNGKLPIIFANEARKKGASVIALAIKGLTSPELENCVDKIYWGRITETKRAFEILRQEKINFIAMTGKIPKAVIFDKNYNFDEHGKDVLKNTIDNKDYTIFKVVASKLRKDGIRVLDSTIYLSPLLQKRGVLTRRHPTDKEWEDIRFGEKMARKIAGLDIGQTVIVKQKSVLAVEAIEGTDKAIKRAGTLKGEGAVVVKVARPRQDMRFDIPAIGPETIDSLIEAKAGVLAIEARRTLVVDKEEIVRKADKAGIAIAAI